MTPTRSAATTLGTHQGGELSQVLSRRASVGFRKRARSGNSGGVSGVTASLVLAAASSVTASLVLCGVSGVVTGTSLLMGGSSRARWPEFYLSTKRRRVPGNGFVRVGPTPKLRAPATSHVSREDHPRARLVTDNRSTVAEPGPSSASLTVAKHPLVRSRPHQLVLSGQQHS
jgi:hypothetical protein